MVESQHIAATFASTAPRAERQTWFLAVSPQEVTLRRDGQSLQFPTSGW
jgi:hypothetical protein